MALVWFVLVNRNADRLESADCTELPADTLVIEFLSVIVDPMKHDNPHLRGVPVRKLKVYNNWEEYSDPLRENLRADTTITGRGENIANAIIVKVPHVWYQLVCPRSSSVLADTVINWVPLASDYSVRDLRNAVSAQEASFCWDSQLGYST
ncbi:unnamed protein product [Phytophthora fragariaefolia]|uniref:Unnamed protein product n=1 Tax=Phytophthora fragariaefolia TaxID=1490495 RepID=A0A9W6XU51_9STRA|nr:unnamed protein product [Phytophthora fragariaefolia]